MQRLDGLNKHFCSFCFPYGAGAQRPAVAARLFVSAFAVKKQEPTCSMQDIDQLALANGLLPAVLEAGRIEMRYYDSEIEVERKADKTPVTEADRAAEVVLLKALSELMPDVPVVAEEQVAAGQIPEINNTFFLVDPLDGTREFINKRGEFTVNIGLVIAGKPVFGLIYAPVLKRFFVPTDPQTALEFEVAPSSAVSSFSSLCARKLSVRTPKDDGIVAFASRSHRTEETDAFLERQGVTQTRKVGSSLKFCLIASGEADLYPRLGPTSEWDIAAGHAILTVAGGHVARLDGAPLTYGKADQKFLNPEFVAWGGMATPKLGPVSTV